MISSAHILEAEPEMMYLKAPECLLAFWTQLGASAHKPLSGFGRQFVGIGMPSEREGTIPDEVGHDEVSRRLLFVAGLSGSRGRVKRDQTREVEVFGGLDSVGRWEEDAPKSDKDAPERAQQVVHLVEGRSDTNGEESRCWKTDDQTRALYEYRACRLNVLQYT